MATEPEDELRRLLAEESFVRSLAHRLVADDADEVVQQTYAQAMQRGMRDVEQPRSWLARIARNVISNLRRSERVRTSHERAAADRPLVPSPAELAEREERRRALVAAVDALPDGLRTVVLLRWFDGQPPRRIAAALGVPAASVSTRLQRAYRLLRERLDDEHGGDRRAWLVPLVPFAVRPELPQAAPLTTLLPAATAAIAMTTKTKLTITAAALVALAATLAFWPDGDAPPRLPDAPQTNGAPGVARGGVDSPAAAAAPTAPAIERELAADDAPPPPANDGLGAVVVRVRYGDDQTPAADAEVNVSPLGSDPRFDGRRVRTDAEGFARFDDLAPGRYYARSPNGRGKRAEVVAGGEQSLELVLDVGVTLVGVVVDQDDRPVADALVEATPMAAADAHPIVVARTAGDGTFRVRAAPALVIVGARADGYTASRCRFVHGRDGNTAELRLELGPDGGAVTGVVVDAHGAPVADAAVVVGDGELTGIAGRDDIPPFPALVRSDEQGRFRAIGVPPGAQPVQVRASGFAPWRDECEVATGADAALRVVLARGGIVRGVARDDRGKPVAGANVESGSWSDIDHFRTRTDGAGAFELRGLPLGELELRANHDDHGKARATVATLEGAPVTCELTLSRGLVLRGRVVDENGQPVPTGIIEALARPAAGGKPFFAFSRVDAQGEFTVANCPDPGSITLTVRARGFDDRQEANVDPKAGEVVVRLTRRAPPSVHIAGTVVGPDGAPVANATVSLQRHGAMRGQGLAATGDDGRFERGPLTPGQWSVTVRSTAYPTWRSEAHELAADESWQMGTITLEAGGTAALQVRGDQEGARFLCEPVGRAGWGTFRQDSDPPVSEPLSPGDYRLLVRGDGIAAHAVPFTIRAGEQTPVDVEVTAGVKQVVECELPEGLDATTVTLRVHRGGVYCGRGSAYARDGSTPSDELFLAPGTYTITAEAGERSGAVTCTVRTAPGAPVRVRLR